MGDIFTRRVLSEAPPDLALSVVPGSIVSGELSPSARLVCGTVHRRDALGIVSDDMYSLNVVRTPFGIAVNDGYTSATAPDRKAASDDFCLQLLRSHVAHYLETGKQ